MMTRNDRIELLKELANAFGPTAIRISWTDSET